MSEFVVELLGKGKSGNLNPQKVPHRVWLEYVERKPPCFCRADRNWAVAATIYRGDCGAAVTSSAVSFARQQRYIFHADSGAVSVRWQGCPGRSNRRWGHSHHQSARGRPADNDHWQRRRGHSVRSRPSPLAAVHAFDEEVGQWYCMHTSHLSIPCLTCFARRLQRKCRDGGTMRRAVATGAPLATVTEPFSA